ncbi:MAG: hypothetical protein KC546_07545 [Anaerolineae bacterium]|nr:hypothetical protein [Anaerolineae bacterium]
MRRRLLMTITSLAVALTVVVFFMMNLQDAVDPTDELIIQLTSASPTGGSAVRTFDLQASGAVSFVMPPGMSAWHRVDGAGSIPVHNDITFVGADGEPDWVLVIALPEYVDPVEYTLNEANPGDFPFAYILPPSSMVESTHYNRGATGTITITTVDEEAGISGSFDLTLSAADGSTVAATGTFTEIPLLN